MKITHSLRLSASARARLTAFIESNPGAHMPTAAHVESRISTRLERILSHASCRDDLIGAHVRYESEGALTAAYKYSVRGLSANFIVRARSIDFESAEVKKFYPRTAESVDVSLSSDAIRRIRAHLYDDARETARKRLNGLAIGVIPAVAAA